MKPATLVGTLQDAPHQHADHVAREGMKDAGTTNQTMAAVDTDPHVSMDDIGAGPCEIVATTKITTPTHPHAAQVETTATPGDALTAAHIFETDSGTTGTPAGPDRAVSPGEPTLPETGTRQPGNIRSGGTPRLYQDSS